jgi:ATP-dependent 26S proteasome regulatory subunit
MAKVEELMNLTRTMLALHSIYKGKALVFEEDLEEEGILKQAFGFFKLNGKSKSDLILPRHVFEAVNAAVFTLIEKAEMVKARGVPTKRSVVLDGRPGTGKTLAMTVAAGLSVKHGMTFVLLRNVGLLKQAIDLIQFYGYTPAIIAAEDIDRVTNCRDEQANAILNAIDGVDSKSMDIRFLFTTNDRANIIETFQRSGRTDMFITLPIPDAECASKLLQRYADDTFVLSSSEFLKIGALLAEAESLPSNIAEVAQRAKLYAISQDKDNIDFQLMQDLALNVIEEKRAGQPKVIQPKGAFEILAGRVEKLALKARVEVQ